MNASTASNPERKSTCFCCLFSVMAVLQKALKEPVPEKKTGFRLEFISNKVRGLFSGMGKQMPNTVTTIHENSR